MDYLVTWNYRHIANGPIVHRLTAVNVALGRATPVIVTLEVAAVTVVTVTQSPR